MAYRIENCDWEFKFQCPVDWEQLVRTNKEDVRVCDVCLKEVYRCISDADVHTHAALGHCVAIRVEEYEDDSSGGYLLGDIDLDSF